MRSNKAITGIIRPLSLLLLCCSVFTLASCGFIVWNGGEKTPYETVLEETEPTDTVLPSVTLAEEAVPTQPKPADSLAHIKNADLSASSVIIATVDSTTVCPISSDNDPVIAARTGVKHRIEQKFDTTVVTAITDAKTMIETARESFNSDMYYADLLLPHAKDVGQLYAEGLLANLYSLPHVNFEAEYYDIEMSSEAIAGNGIYAVSGAANFNPDYLPCLFYNRKAAAELGLGDISQLVTDGGWTNDKFREFSLAAKASLGIWGHGSASDLNDYTDLLSAAGGIDYVTSTYKKTPVIDYLEDGKSAKTHSIIEKISALIYSDDIYFKSSGDECRSAFNTGNLLFMADGMYYSEWISDSSIEWGILPFPKNSEEDSYRTLISGESPVFCALINTPGYETSGLILESLNAAAYGVTLEAYKNKLIDYTLRDSASIKMLDVICESAVNDFVHIYASGFNSLESATLTSVYKAVTTTRSVDQYYRNYRYTANSALSSGVYAQD